MTEQSTKAEQATSPAPRVLPFHEVVTAESQAFAKFLLNTVPELESVALVFSYGFQSPDLPFAIVLGQNDGLKTPVEIIHMCQQLARTWNHQMQNGQRCIQLLDAYMGEKAKELKQLQEQINAINTQLASVSATDTRQTGT